MRLTWLRTVLLTTALLLVGCDHGTKHFAKAHLEGGPSHPLVAGILELSYTENTDSGFSLLRWLAPAVRTPLLTATQLLGGLALLALALRRKLPVVARIAFLLMTAGALGNGMDRLFHGHVVDFIYLHHWPVFNLADIYITVGAALLVLAYRGMQANRRAVGGA